MDNNKMMTFFTLEELEKGIQTLHHASNYVEKILTVERRFDNGAYEANELIWKTIWKLNDVLTIRAIHNALDIIDELRAVDSLSKMDTGGTIQ